MGNPYPTAESRTLALFDLEPTPAEPADLSHVHEADDAARAQARRLTVLPTEPAQMSLDLPTKGAPDLLAATRRLCLAQADECAERDCRYALPGVEFQGVKFFCAIEVAMAYPHGLPPVHVARLMGESESDVQRIERTAADRHPAHFRRLRRAAFGDGLDAGRRGKIGASSGSLVV